MSSGFSVTAMTDFTVVEGSRATSLVVVFFFARKMWQGKGDKEFQMQ